MQYRNSGSYPFAIQRGSLGDFFVLCLKNAAFTICTLGIYVFWAKVDIQRFITENTEYMGGRFRYLATGEERFRGFLRALPYLVGFYLCIFVFLHHLIVLFLHGQGYADAYDYANIICYSLAAIAWGFLLPELKVGKLRYELGRTKWRNVAFSFRGSVRECFSIYLQKWAGITIGYALCFLCYNVFFREAIFAALTSGSWIKTYFLVAILGALSLGPGTCWGHWKMRKFQIENSFFGDTSFEFKGDFIDYLLLSFEGCFISILSFGVYYGWWAARAHNYFWSKTYFQQKRLVGTMRGSDYSVATVLGLLISGLTLGIGRPIAGFLKKRLEIESISGNRDIDFTRILAHRDQAASALQHGLMDAGEALDAVAGMF